MGSLGNFSSQDSGILVNMISVIPSASSVHGEG